jgi:hypothetical protein
MLNFRLLWFSLGMMLLSLLLGFMTGASSSPVAGVAITSVFGVAVTVLALFQRFSIEKKLDLITLPSTSEEGEQADFSTALTNLANLEQQIHDSLNSIGKFLILFVISFSFGIFIGSQVRVSEWPKQDTGAKKFPWTIKKAPKLAENALDWIVVQEQLLKLGYTEEQIRELYSMQSEHWKANGELSAFGVAGSFGHSLSSIFTGLKTDKPSSSGAIVDIDNPTKSFDNGV